MKTMLLGTLAVLLTVTLQGVPGTTMKLPEIGKPAPTFRLNDHTGKATPFGGKRPGWSVLAFFPKAATPG